MTHTFNMQRAHIHTHTHAHTPSNTHHALKHKHTQPHSHHTQTRTHAHTHTHSPRHSHIHVVTSTLQRLGNVLLYQTPLVKDPRVVGMHLVDAVKFVTQALVDKHTNHKDHEIPVQITGTG